MPGLQSSRLVLPPPNVQLENAENMKTPELPAAQSKPGVEVLPVNNRRRQGVNMNILTEVHVVGKGEHQVYFSLLSKFLDVSALLCAQKKISCGRLSGGSRGMPYIDHWL